MDDNLLLSLVAWFEAGFVGLILSFSGNLKKAVAKQFELTEPQGAALWLAARFFFFSLILIGGLAAESIPPKALLSSGAILAGLGLFGFTLKRDYPTAFGFALITAGGLGVMTSTSFLLLSQCTFFKPAASFSLGLLFLEGGLLAGPNLFDSLSARLDFRRLFCGLAIGGLIPAAVAALLPFPAGPARTEDLPLVENSAFWLLLGIAALYPVLEMGGHAWTRNSFPAKKAWIGFWATLMVMRLVLAVVFNHYSEARLDKPWLLCGLGLGLAIVAGHLGASAHPKQGDLFVWLYAGLLSPVLPLTAAMLFRKASSAPGTAAGALAVALTLGALFLPSAIDSFVRRHGSPLAAWRFMAMVALFITLFSLVLAVLLA